MRTTQKFGRIVDGQIDYAPYPFFEDGQAIYSTNPAVYLARGYKSITYEDMPVREGYSYTELWTEDETTITRGWEEHANPPVPDGPTYEDMVQALDELGVSTE